MREATVLETMRPEGEVPLGDRLALEVGILAGRLAGELENVPTVRERLTGGLEFLRSATVPPPPSRPRWARGLSIEERRPPGPPHPLDLVADRLGLDSLALELLVLAGAAEEHEGFASVFSSLHPGGEPYPTAGLAALVVAPSPDEREALRGALVAGVLHSFGLVEAHGDGPFFHRTLRVADGLWPALHGVDTLPRELETVPVPDAVDGLEEWLETPDVRRAAAAVRGGGAWLIHLATDRLEEGVQRGAALVRSAGARPFPVRPTGSAEDVSARVVLHATVRGAVPVMAPGTAEGAGRLAVAGFAAAPGPVVVCAPHGGVRFPQQRPVLEVRCDPLSLTARARLWAGALPELSGGASVLASSYTADAPTVLATARDARARAALDGRTVEPADVVESLRARASGGGVEGVVLRRPTATWDDLVLAEDRLAQLREALGRVRHQKTVLDDWGFLAGRPGARGVRMLLSGPPGTGKSLSAEILAGALGVDLLAADVSRLVSKWIGETEKNLARVFDAAERSQAVLLFDEADALFAKRTEVADSTSRYANLETAYLLTRLERYEGLAILSTNLRRNIDQAFLRRLEFLVEYEEPGRDERLALWRCHLPDGAPLADDLRLEEVATLYPLVGGHIRNAAVAAAFLAAEEESPLTRSCLIRAIRREYAKAGRAFPGPPPDMA